MQLKRIQCTHNVFPSTCMYIPLKQEMERAVTPTYHFPVWSHVVLLPMFLGLYTWTCLRTGVVSGFNPPENGAPHRPTWRGQNWTQGAHLLRTVLHPPPPHRRGMSCKDVESRQRWTRRGDPRPLHPPRWSLYLLWDTEVSWEVSDALPGPTGHRPVGCEHLP